jgi:AcrR family transcriptional regulator
MTSTKKEELMRDFILEASEDLFVKHGFEKTSMDMIAKKSDLSKPTLYKYFTNKYELFMNLYIRFQKELLEKTKELLLQDKNKFAILEDVIDTTFSRIVKKERFLRMFFREHHLIVHPNIDENFETYLHDKDEMNAILCRFLDEMIDPTIKRDYGVEMVSMSIYNILEGLFLDFIVGSKSEHEKQKRYIIRLLKKGVFKEEA